MADDSKTRQSDAQRAKLQRAEDGKRAMAEYLAERDAVRAKTTRLRELRLAREAELKRAAQVADTNKKSGGSKTRKAKSGADRSAA